MSAKRPFHIECQGCDATTRVQMDLTPKEAALIFRLCELVTKTSTYGCEPKMEMKEFFACSTCGHDKDNHRDGEACRELVKGGGDAYGYCKCVVFAPKERA